MLQEQQLLKKITFEEIKNFYNQIKEDFINGFPKQIILNQNNFYYFLYDKKENNNFDLENNKKNLIILKVCIQNNIVKNILLINIYPFDISLCNHKKSCYSKIVKEINNFFIKN
jgi:hypothetical protein